MINKSRTQQNFDVDHFLNDKKISDENDQHIAPQIYNYRLGFFKAHTNVSERNPSVKMRSFICSKCLKLC